MIINQSNLNHLFTAFQAKFAEGFKAYQPQSQWARVATRVPSSTAKNHYAWMGHWPSLREWVGERHLKSLSAQSYRIANKKYEATIEVPRDTIEDDQYGVFAPVVSGMGAAAAQHPDHLIWALLAEGFTASCFDGQPFFSTAHPVGTGTQSNSGGGSGNAWFLLDTKKPLKPLIFQERRAYALKSMTKADDESVFMRDAYRYGVDARVSAGFAFWQQAYGSKQTLSKAVYATARGGMMALKSETGQPLGIMPDLLVVPPALESKGLELLNAERDDGGKTNIYRESAELLVVPWLSE